MSMKNERIIYQAENGAIALRGDVQHETIWANQKELAKIFDVTPQNITTHIKQIFKDGELEEDSTCKDSLQVQMEGKREVSRSIKTYNLDVMIAVGYRVNSVVGTKFRRWATQTLKQHITQGYTINKRTGAFSFIWFLQKAGIDFKGKLTPEALTSITLLIAESEAASKDRMIGLVILLLNGKKL